MSTAEKYNSLEKILKSLGKVIVAYSGGVDSTFLLKAAVDTLGPENVLACIGTSPSLAETQYAQAVQLAQAIGAKLQTIQLEELDDPNYAANNPDRCFHCKSHLYKILNDLAEQQNFTAVICGANYDDKDDFRPGNKAAQTLGVHAPLMQAELTKNEIRQLSRDLNLATADKPASPCLASRVSYGLEVTAERLKQIEQAEDFLTSLGFVEFRVRHHDTIARIEVSPEDIDKITTEPTRTKVMDKLKSLGFKYVAIDLQGFRSGSLNETLTKQQKQKNN